MSPIRWIFLGAMITLVASSDSEIITQNSTGYKNGYFYTYWRDGGSVDMSLEPDLAYSASWKVNKNNFVGGIGWGVGSSNRVIGYNIVTWTPNGNAYLALYGWTRDPLVEYYVVESWGNWRPPGGKSLGTIYSDGGKYNLYRTKRINKPSIVGTQTFYQYWSVRTSKQSTKQNHTITFGNHVDAWAGNGWILGSHDYQVMATEGFQSSGLSSIEILKE